MKNASLKLGFILLIGVMVISNCKKGENDPFIALRTRDARITGIWELTNQMTKVVTTSFQNLDLTTSITTQTFDGNFMIMSTPSGTNTYQYFREITIEKDGTFSLNEITEGVRTEITGHWWWLADRKNKTRIAFGDDSESFEIDRLKNKELILMQESYSKSTGIDGDFTSITKTSSFTFAKKK